MKLTYLFTGYGIAEGGVFKTADVTLTNDPAAGGVKLAVDIETEANGCAYMQRLAFMLHAADLCGGKSVLLPALKTHIATVCMEEIPFMTADEIGEVQLLATDLLESFLPR